MKKHHSKHSIFLFFYRPQSRTTVAFLLINLIPSLNKGMHKKFQQVARGGGPSRNKESQNEMLRFRIIFKYENEDTDFTRRVMLATFARGSSNLKVILFLLQFPRFFAGLLQNNVRMVKEVGWARGISMVARKGVENKSSSFPVCFCRFSYRFFFLLLLSFSLIGLGES